MGKQKAEKWNLTALEKPVCGIWAAAARWACSWRCLLRDSTCFLYSCHHPDSRCSWYSTPWSHVSPKTTATAMGHSALKRVFVSTLSLETEARRDSWTGWTVRAFSPSSQTSASNVLVSVCWPLIYFWVSEITKEQINKELLRWRYNCEKLSLPALC